MASRSYNLGSSTISRESTVKAKDHLTSLPTEILEEILALVLDDYRTIHLSVTDKQTIPEPDTQEIPNQIVWREAWIPSLRLVCRRFSNFFTPLIGERAVPTIKIDITMSGKEAISLRRANGTKIEARDFSSLCPNFVRMFTKKAYFMNLGMDHFRDNFNPFASVCTYSPKDPRPVQLRYSWPLESFYQ